MKNDNTKDLHTMEGGAYMDSNSINTALEEFFNNVLDCIVINEEVSCAKE